MSLNSTKNRVNAFLTGISNNLDNYQSEPYWQGLSTHSSIPAHTNANDNDAVPDRMGNSPSDQISWADANFIPQPITTWPCSLVVNVYDGPSGKGYELTASFDYEGDVWRRVIHTGPESYRQQNWQKMEAGL